MLRLPFPTLVKGLKKCKQTVLFPPLYQNDNGFSQTFLQCWHSAKTKCGGQAMQDYPEHHSAADIFKLVDFSPNR